MSTKEQALLAQIENLKIKIFGLYGEIDRLRIEKDRARSCARHAIKKELKLIDAIQTLEFFLHDESTEEDSQ